MDSRGQVPMVSNIVHYCSKMIGSAELIFLYARNVCALYIVKWQNTMCLMPNPFMLNLVLVSLSNPRHDLRKDINLTRYLFMRNCPTIRDLKTTDMDNTIYKYSPFKRCTQQTACPELSRREVGAWCALILLFLTLLTSCEKFNIEDIQQAGDIRPSASLHITTRAAEGSTLTYPPPCLCLQHQRSARHTAGYLKRLKVPLAIP